MALPFLIQRRHIAVRVEDTEGTDAVPADADVIVPAYNIEYAPTVEMFEREVLQPSFSRITQIAGEQSAVIRFSTELKGEGAAIPSLVAPPNLSAPLQAAGMSESVVAATAVTYLPANQAIPSATIEIREGAVGTEARSFKIVGARGTWALEAVKGDIVMINFEFTGKYVEPVTTSITQFTPTPPITPLPIAFLNAALTFQGVGSLKVQTVTMDIANIIALRNDVNDPTGNLAAEITGRSPVGTIDPEGELTTTINTYLNWTSQSEGILQFVLGTSSGNIVTVSAPKAQILTVGQGDRDGIRTDPLDLQFGQSVQAGDDEIKIAIT